MTAIGDSGYSRSKQHRTMQNHKKQYCMSIAMVASGRTGLKTQRWIAQYRNELRGCSTLELTSAQDGPTYGGSHKKNGRDRFRVRSCNFFFTEPKSELQSWKKVLDFVANEISQYHFGAL